MQVRKIQQNNMNFGMALHVSDTKTLQRFFSNGTVHNIEASKPMLKEFAKDVDIFISPERFENTNTNWLKIRVRKDGAGKPTRDTDTFVHSSFCTPEKLVRIVKETKNDYLSSIAGN